MAHYFLDSMQYVRPLPRHKLCLQVEMVTLQQKRKNDFAVRYGCQVDDGLTYSQACDKLGQALMHQAACNGTLNNEGVG